MIATIFNPDDVDFFRFRNQICSYCGDQICGAMGKDGPYEKEPSVPRCFTCEWMKWRHTKDEFIKHCRRIVAHAGQEVH